MSNNGKIINSNQGQKTEEQPKENLEGEKIINSVTIMELKIHKLENGKESLEIIAQEFMMTEHKDYMIDKLLEALHIVNHAEKRKPLIKTISQQGWRSLKEYLRKRK